MLANATAGLLRPYMMSRLHKGHEVPASLRGAPRQGVEPRVASFFWA